MNNEECAKMFCDAIRLMGKRPLNIHNLENYLSLHFDTWIEKYANDPESLAEEMKSFAEMKLD
nr:hypothetical protein [Clostridium sp. Marseille-P7770]